MIEAVALLCNEFPDIKVKVGGANIFEVNWIKGNSYGIYIRQLLKKYDIQYIHEIAARKDVIVFDLDVMAYEDVKKYILKAMGG